MKVLVAEDDRIFQLLLGQSLSAWGYEVVTAANGEDALAAILAPNGPQFAILDWIMPKMDGLEVCRQVRGANLPAYVYVILLTATQSSNLIPGFEAGVDDYLFKPVNLNELRLRLRAGRRVLEAGQWYRSIAETASDGIAILNDQRVVFGNRAAEEIFGFAPGEMLGREFSTLIAGVDLRKNRHGEVAKTMEIATRHCTGRDIVLEVSVSEIPLEQSNHLTVLIRDVTERKTLEMQRAQTYKMQSIGQLAAGVAHEINTPIQYIGDNVSFLQESYRHLDELLNAYAGLLDELRPSRCAQAAVERIDELSARIDLAYLREEAPRAIEQSLEGVEQVAGIVAAMKEFSHAGSSELLPTNLNHVIQSAAVITKSSWKYIADLRFDLAPDLPPVFCSPGELRQVFLNLIVNATDAITDAVQISPGKKGLIVISSRRDGETAEIRVSDTGTGIPEAIREKVFDLFFTTKEVGKGTGQGLALAYSTVVTRHGGTLEFESEIGLGSTFILRLPIAGAVAAEQALAAAGIFEAMA